jgi:hypothetical protein
MTTRGYRFLIIERDGTVATRQAWLNSIVVDDGDLSPVGPDDPNVIDAMEQPGASVSLVMHDELKAMLRLLLAAEKLTTEESTRALELAGTGPLWQAPPIDTAGA